LILLDEQIHFFHSEFLALASLLLALDLFLVLGEDFVLLDLEVLILQALFLVVFILVMGSFGVTELTLIEAELVMGI